MGPCPVYRPSSPLGILRPDTSTISIFPITWYATFALIGLFRRTTWLFAEAQTTVHGYINRSQHSLEKTVCLLNWKESRQRVRKGLVLRNRQRWIQRICLCWNIHSTYIYVYMCHACAEQNFSLPSMLILFNSNDGWFHQCFHYGNSRSVYMIVLYIHKIIYIGVQVWTTVVWRGLDTPILKA